jgi:hypothetical protein
MRKRDINLRKKNNKQTQPEVQPWKNGWKEHVAKIEADKAAKEAALKKEAKDQARRKLNGWIDASLLAHSKIYFDCECGWPNLMISERMPCGSCRWCCTCESHEGTEEVMCLCGTHVQQNNAEIWNEMNYEHHEYYGDVKFHFDNDDDPLYKSGMLEELEDRINEIARASFGHVWEGPTLNAHVSRCQVMRESMAEYTMLLIMNDSEDKVAGWDRDQNLLDEVWNNDNVQVSKDAPNMVRMRVVRMKLRMMSDSQRREFYALYSAEVARLFEEWLDSKPDFDLHEDYDRLRSEHNHLQRGPWGGVYLPSKFWRVQHVEDRLDLEKEVRKRMWDVYRFDDAVMQWMQATVMRITDGENS